MATSTTLTIRGVPVTFPFEPYEIQKEYMDKVIQCLQDETNGVLESPTGTGKTLSLLCASLAWLTIKKAQVQAQRCTVKWEGEGAEEDDFLKTLQAKIDKKVGNATQNGQAFHGIPTIIYASRTHSQLSQAMQELKRTAYTHMKATVVGSREQMCVHPEVSREENSAAKIHMCRLQVQSKNCHFYNRVERMKDDPVVTNMSIMDIEDLVKVGQEKKFCPYFMAKELKQRADIVFMPYNYLLDPRARKALGIDLFNSIVILDEAHNIERICEDSASMQITSSDITMCVEEVTEVMKAMTEEPIGFNSETPKDFTPDELCHLKQMLLDLEKTIDHLELKLPLSEGTTFEGDYIFEIFQKAGIKFDNSFQVENLIDKIVQFLATAQSGPFQRKGNGLDLFAAVIRIVFASDAPEFKAKIKKCYKVHVTSEEPKKKVANDWLSKATATSKQGGRVLSFWCFSPGFGMTMLMERGVKCLILTSGTLAPLKPLISELELNVPVRLENPHIVKKNQIMVNIVSKGPDGTELNSNFQNRNNPRYVSSLGRTILNLSRIIPNGLLIFFPSYPIMLKCQQDWQEEGIWGSIWDQKAIYVEPKQKVAFNTAMAEYYARVQNPQYKGAIFMGVCRGKISEGLDFADINGRAVIITGLPYPPLKDPRIILKRKYLDLCRIQNKEYLSGDDWYTLEATRAVNQAMGRVIRHQYDYGAIILLDTRFSGFRIKSQMSMWLRERLRLVNNFGEIIRELRMFFRNADANLPAPKPKSLKPAENINPPPAEFNTSNPYIRKANFNFSTSSSCSSLTSDDSHSSGLVAIHNRDANGVNATGVKRKRITIVPFEASTKNSAPTEASTAEYIGMVKNALDPVNFKAFVEALRAYRDTAELDKLTCQLDNIFLNKYNLRYIIQGLSPYIKNSHKEKFEEYWEKMR